MKTITALAFAFLTTGNTFEIGAGSGVGEPLGRLGAVLIVNNDWLEASIGKHFAWNDFTATISGKVLGLGRKNRIMLGLTYARNFEEIADGPYEQRACIGAYDLHDFGSESGFKAYYGFQLARYFINKNDFDIVIPILGLSYSFTID